MASSASFVCLLSHGDAQVYEGFGDSIDQMQKFYEDNLKHILMRQVYSHHRHNPQYLIILTTCTGHGGAPKCYSTEQHGSDVSCSQRW